MGDLLHYLDLNQIEMETDHLSFSMAQLLKETGIPPPPGAKQKSPGRTSKPGPKCSKKNKDPETSDEEVERCQNENKGSGIKTKPGPKSSKRLKECETRDEEMEVDDNDDRVYRKHRNQDLSSVRNSMKVLTKKW